jgi:hypothetical protein
MGALRINTQHPRHPLNILIEVLGQAGITLETGMLDGHDSSGFAGDCHRMAIASGAQAG